MRSLHMSGEGLETFPRKAMRCGEGAAVVDREREVPLSNGTAAVSKAEGKAAAEASQLRS